MSHISTVLLKCLVALAVVANLCWLGYFVSERMRKEKEGEPDKKAEPSRPNVVTLKNEAQEKLLALEVEDAGTCDWKEARTVYGRVVSNPRGSYELRAPFAGTVRAADGGEWPTPGRRVKAGDPLGQLLVRIGPQERLDLQAKLTEAKLKQDGADKVLKLRAGVVERLSKATSTVIAQRELDEARVQLEEARVQLATSEAAVKLWQQALDEIDGLKGPGASLSRPLKVPVEGPPDALLEVAEVAVQPGTAVEAGALLARFIDVGRPLVRLDLPPEALQQGIPDKPIDLFAIVSSAPSLRGPGATAEATTPAPSLKAVRIGPAPQVDSSSQLVGYLYAVQGLNGAAATPDDAQRQRLETLRRLWRPGLFVRADWPTGETTQAVTVPDGALLYHQGRALVYVRLKPREYERREVRVLGRKGDCWVIAPRSPFDPPLVGVLPREKLPSGERPAEKVVSSEAQSLLALEFRKDVDDD